MVIKGHGSSNTIQNKCCGQWDQVMMQTNSINMTSIKWYLRIWDICFHSGHMWQAVMMVTMQSILNICWHNLSSFQSRGQFKARQDSHASDHASYSNPWFYHINTNMITYLYPITVISLWLNPISRACRDSDSLTPRYDFHSSVMAATESDMRFKIGLSCMAGDFNF